MGKRGMAVVVIAGIISLSCAAVFAMCGSCGSDHTAKSEEAASSAPIKADNKIPVKVNNAVCPVTDDKVDMKNPITVEYDGKLYNLCCPACIEPFKENPGKYIEKIAKWNRGE